MLKLNLSNIKNILIIVLLIFGFIQGVIYVNNRNEIRNQEINIAALNDSIKITTDKYNRQVYSKNILLADYKDLLKYNGDLAKEIKSGKQKNLAEITKLNLKINNLSDSLKKINGSLIKQDSNLYVYEFKDSTEFRRFKTQVEVVSTLKPESTNLRVIEDIVLADLIIKKYITKDSISLSVYSNNPKLEIGQIEGSIVDISKYTKVAPKKKFSVNTGFQIGVGGVWGWKQTTPLPGIYAGFGIGLSHNLFNF